MRNIAICAAAVLGLAMSMSYPAKAESTGSRDPAKANPQYYKVLLDNDAVRVLEYRSAPGDKESVETYCPGVLYVLGPGTVKLIDADGKADTQQVKAGDIAWRDKSTHGVENVGDTDLHALSIDIKSTGCTYGD